MPDESLERTRTRFVQGAFLAWIPFLLCFVPAFFNAFRGIGQSKATGLAAVAGGWAEGLLIFGLTALVISQVTAVVLLTRSFSTEKVGRNFLSVASICCSAFML
jgi:hypothetical protein